MSARFPFLGLAWAVMWSVSGCAHPGEDTARPANFDVAARAFRAKSGTDRRAEGERVAKLLPKCPVTWEKDIGTGTLVAFDYSHPSYRISKSEIVQALGPPAKSSNDTVLYELAVLTNHMVWELSVDFHDDYAVGTMIFGSLKSGQ
jgi:hypothetical protein